MVEWDGVFIMVDDDCMLFEEGEVLEMCFVCFCMLGCYLFIGVVELEVVILFEVI